jgi:hypothetical protein
MMAMRDASGNANNRRMMRVGDGEDELYKGSAIGLAEGSASSSD